jgi:hypothetical protein
VGFGALLKSSLARLNLIGKAFLPSPSFDKVRAVQNNPTVKVRGI